MFRLFEIRFWKGFFTFFSTVFLFNMGLAQNFEEKPESWTIFKEQNSIKIYYKFDQCEINQTRSQEVVLFRYENTGQTPKNLNWHMKLWYNDDCKTCNKEEEYTYQLQLEAGGEQSDVCKRTPDARFQVLSRFLKHGQDTRLTDFEMSDFNVQQLSD